jgi:hypothetical protein
MSVTINKLTEYHETAVDVKYKLQYVRVNNLNKLSTVYINGGLLGTVGDTEGQVDYIEPTIHVSQLVANTTPAERQIVKQAMAIFERELARANEQLEGQTHNDGDVFV